MDYHLITQICFFKLASEPNIKSFMMINPKLVGVHMVRITVCLDHVVYAAMVILDCAKAYPMYQDIQKLVLADTPYEQRHQNDVIYMATT